MEVEAAVDPTVCTFLAALSDPRIAESKRPGLELELVFSGEGGSSGVISGFADYVVRGFDLRTKGVGESLLDEADGQVGDVDADPAAIEALGDLDGGAATAEGSRTTSPSLELALMMRSRRASGF